MLNNVKLFKNWKNVKRPELEEGMKSKKGFRKGKACKNDIPKE